MWSLMGTTVVFPSAVNILTLQVLKYTTIFYHGCIGKKAIDSTE